jgi:hypothetical protein
MKKIFVIITFVLFNLYAGVAQTYTPTTSVKTPKGTTVPNAGTLSSADLNYNSSQLAAYEAEIKMLYGSTLVFLGPPTYKYNCHAYAWHISEGGSNVWIGTPGHKKYWEDGSYAKVVGANDASAPDGAKVVYDPTGNGDHSAVKISSGVYVSKWGATGLWQHPPNACPSIYNSYNAKDFYIYNIAPIFAGDYLICVGNNATYTAKYVLPGYIWGCSGNLSPVAGTPGKFTANANGAGYVSLTYNGVVKGQRDLWVGPPVISNIGGSTYVPANQSNLYYATYPYGTNPSSFNWEISPLGSGYVSGSGENVYVTFYQSGDYQLLTRASNTCGNSSYTMIRVNAY